MADIRDQEIKAATIDASRPKPHEKEDYLDDDKVGKEADFVGATLHIGGQTTGRAEPVVDFRGMGIQSEEQNAGALNRNRPGSRKSTTSRGSRTSWSGQIFETDFTKQLYFCSKDGAFENAVEIVRDSVIKADLDGELRGAWLLTEIDHWDNEREKIVLLTDKSVLLVKYDFITCKVLEDRRIFLHIINKVQVGNFKYPAKSLMKARDHGGIRFYWGSPEMLSFGQRWNPWCTDIPYTTLAHHRLIYNEKERETVTFNVEDFYESFIQAVKASYKGKEPGKTLEIVEEDILIESYASVTSAVFNQSHLGFNRDRGGVSF